MKKQTEQRDESKICKNCAHSKIIKWSYPSDLYFCQRPSFPVDLVDGHSASQHCDFERKNGDCGPSGKHYVERVVCKECEVKDAEIKRLKRPLTIEYSPCGSTERKARKWWQGWFA